MKEPILITEGSIASGIYFLIKEKIAHPEKEYTMKDLSFMKCRGFFRLDAIDDVVAFDNTGEELNQVEFDYFENYQINLKAAKLWCRNPELTIKEAYLELNTNPKQKLIVLVNGFTTYVDVIPYNENVFQEPDVFLRDVLDYRESEINWSGPVNEAIINYL